jgi:hypothetical protein
MITNPSEPVIDTTTSMITNPTDAVPDTTTTIPLNLNSSANEASERDIENDNQSASPVVIGSVIAVVCCVFAIGGLVIHKRRKENRDDVDYAGIEEGSSVGGDSLEGSTYLEPTPVSTLQTYYEVNSSHVIREKANPIYNHAQPFDENSYPGIDATYAEVQKMPLYECATQESASATNGSENATYDIATQNVVDPEATYDIATSEIEVARYDVGDSMPHYEVASN